MAYKTQHGPASSDPRPRLCSSLCSLSSSHTSLPAVPWTHQAWFCLKVFAFALASAWKAPMFTWLTSIQFLLSSIPFTWQPNLNCLPPITLTVLPNFFFSIGFITTSLYILYLLVFFFSTVSLTGVWALLIPEFPLTCSRTRPWHRVGMQ